MITRIKINGFKSFQDFEMFFTPFTVLAGTNASGKSNLFDALRLLSRLAEMDLKTAFSGLRGNAEELFTQYADGCWASEMEFTVDMLLNRHVRDNWGGSADINRTRLRYQLAIARKENDLGLPDLAIMHESLDLIRVQEDEWAKSVLSEEAGEFWKPLTTSGAHTSFIGITEKEGKSAIAIRQDGRHGNRKITPTELASQTVLSSVNSVDFPHAFAVKKEFMSWKFLQLIPEDMREPTSQDLGSSTILTSSGKNLAGALYRISKTNERDVQINERDIKEISRRLNSFLPTFTDVNVYDDQANHQFIIKIKGENGKEFSSRVLSDGTLRLLALCVLERDPQHTGLLCLEEPENGVHPFRMNIMLQLLKDLSTDFSTEYDSSLRQVIISTHSPALVRKAMRSHSDRNSSVWFSRLISRITTIDDKRVKLKITHVTPVSGSEQEVFPFVAFMGVTDAEQKMTTSEAAHFLEFYDSEIEENDGGDWDE